MPRDDACASGCLASACRALRDHWRANKGEEARALGAAPKEKKEVAEVVPEAKFQKKRVAPAVENDFVLVE